MADCPLENDSISHKVQLLFQIMQCTDRAGYYISFGFDVKYSATVQTPECVPSKIFLLIFGNVLVSLLVLMKK